MNIFLSLFYSKTGDRTSYAGDKVKSGTMYGYACLSWADVAEGYSSSDFPNDDGVPGAVCRSPKSDPGDRPWCWYNNEYTSYQEEWDYCDVYQCD